LVGNGRKVTPDATELLELGSIRMGGRRTAKDKKERRKRRKIVRKPKRVPQTQKKKIVGDFPMANGGLLHEQLYL